MSECFNCSATSLKTDNILRENSRSQRWARKLKKKKDSALRVTRVCCFVVGGPRVTM